MSIIPRDLSVYRLLMLHAVLRNKITAFVCVGEIITNVVAHIFTAALGWWAPRVDTIYRVGELVQMHTLFKPVFTDEDVPSTCFNNETRREMFA